MASRDIDDLHPAMKPLAEKFLANCATDLTFVIEKAEAFLTQTYRSKAEQDADFAQGRTEPGRIITNARGGESPHNVVDADGSSAAVAFDFAVKRSDGSVDWNASDDLWLAAIKIGEALGLVSGSCFHSLKDNPHMELPNWRSYIVEGVNT